MKRIILVSMAVALVSGLWAISSANAQQFSDWSAPENLTTVNSTLSNEAGAFISKDGLSLYFNSTRGGNFDIWVSHRTGKDMPWEAPQSLGPAINTICNEQTPTLSVDGHWLYFARDCGSGQDIFVSQRHNKREDSGWQAAVNLGSGVNTAGSESCPTLFEDEESGITTLYFSRGVTYLTAEDIYVSTLQEDGTFGEAVLVEELSDPAYRDARPFIWKNGLVMLLDSNRPGTLGTFGAQDLWVSTRASTSDPWSTPENLGPFFNSVVLDARPVLSFDGTELYFHSNRDFVSNDLYRSTRTKLKGKSGDAHEDHGE